jgi:chromosome partitioning protein
VKYFGDKVYTTRIPRNVRLSEAPSHGQPIQTYAPASPGGRAYTALSEEIIGRDDAAIAAPAALANAPEVTHA